MTAYVEPLLGAAKALAEADSARDYLVISNGITRDVHQSLSTLLAGRKTQPSCTLFLTTNGGDPAGGYRIARCLRHHYQQIRVAVPSRCKSAGTLIAIAADELAIGDCGELGPLDIQVRKPSELEENSSGLDIMQALQTVSQHTELSFQRMLREMRNTGLATKLCAEFAAQVASGIAAPMLAQIDPIRLGEMQRATRVAFEYGNRLDAYSRNLKDGALSRLIGDYPSHSFVIDRKEAKELFKSVSHLTDAEKTFSSAIWHLLSAQSNIGPEFVDIENFGNPAPGAQNEIVADRPQPDVAAGQVDAEIEPAVPAVIPERGAERRANPEAANG